MPCIDTKQAHTITDPVFKNSYLIIQVYSPVFSFVLQ